ncbi:hypothetical protein CRENBAI_001917, partial [Crenichthys baileyi]
RQRDLGSDRGEDLMVGCRLGAGTLGVIHGITRTLEVTIGSLTVLEASQAAGSTQKEPCLETDWETRPQLGGLDLWESNTSG